MRLSVIAAILILPAVVAALSPHQLAPVAAVFCTIVLLWLTELLPLAATGLFVPVLIVLYGLEPPREAFTHFGSDILFLFIGAFLLAQAMQKHGWDRRMACWVLSSPLGERSPGALIALIAGMTWILSMWISNTAACAILIPMCLGVSAALKKRFPDHQVEQRFTSRMLIACAFAATMGGLATPIGTPPNLIALSFLEDAGIAFSFFEWMLLGLPVSFTMLILLLLVLKIRFPLPHINLHGVRMHFKSELQAMGVLTREEIQVACVFSIAVLLWIAPGMVEQVLGREAGLSRALAPLSLSVVGVGSALLLFVLPGKEKGSTNLSWADAAHIDWGTIMLFGGGLTLGALLEKSGFAAAVGGAVFSQDLSVLTVLTLAVLISILVSEFASNTASASIIIPIVLGAVSQSDPAILSPTVAVLSCAFGASFGFMLPVSTPPNALAYGTKRIALRDMVTTGVIFDALGLALIVAALYIYSLL